MLIIVDKRLPEKALQKLSGYGQLVPFATKDIVYESISGHPDIFMIRLNKQLVVAPNLPIYYKELFSSKKIDFTEGELPVGAKYPETAGYNAVYSDNNKLIHNFRYTDPGITQMIPGADLIHINQGYSRCSLIPLKDEKYITSDHGIERILNRYGLTVLYVDPSPILLPGQTHGFIGGCCGIHGDNIFFTGSLNHLEQGEKVRSFCSGAGYTVIELTDDLLFDGGSILFAGE